MKIALAALLTGVLAIVGTAQSQELPANYYVGTLGTTKITTPVSESDLSARERQRTTNLETMFFYGHPNKDNEPQLVIDQVIDWSDPEQSTRTSLGIRTPRFANSLLRFNARAEMNFPGKTGVTYFFDVKPTERVLLRAGGLYQTPNKHGGFLGFKRRTKLGELDFDIIIDENGSLNAHGVGGLVLGPIYTSMGLMVKEQVLYSFLGTHKEGVPGFFYQEQDNLKKGESNGLLVIADRTTKKWDWTFIFYKTMYRQVQKQVK